MKTKQFLLLIQTLINITLQKKYFSIKLQKEPEAMYYYTKIKINKFAEIKTLILDTGSSLLAVPCNQDTIYNHKKIDDKPEPFYIPYAEGSELRGNIIQDQIRVNEDEDIYTPLPKTIIGCIMSRNGMFKNQFANGIIGLNYGSKFLQEFDGRSSVSLQVCLAERDGFVYVFKDMVLEQDWDFIMRFDDFFSGYSVGFGSILLGGSVSIEKKFQLNFDYGTTFLFLPQLIFKSFMKSLNKFCENGERNCGGYDSMEVDECIEFTTPDDDYDDIEDLLSSFPDLVFRIDDNGEIKDLTIIPHQYFWYDDNVEEEGAIKICMGIREHQFHFVILGNNSLRNKKVIFDRKNMVLKVKQVNCQEENKLPLQLALKNKVIIL